MSMRIRHLARRLQADREGATMVEFAFIAPVLILMLIGGFDLAHQSYVRAVLQGALTDAARRAAVEDPQFVAAGDTLEERVEALVRTQVEPTAPNASVDVVPRNYFDFSGIGNPEKLIRDKDNNGQYDEDDDDCFADVNGNGRYDTDAGSTGRTGVGGANDVVFYEATLEMPRLVPLHVFLDVPATYELHAETAVRNQPYATQITPPTVCGNDA